MKFLIANWKMAPDTLKQATQLARSTYTIAKQYKKHAQILVCVPHVYLAPVRIAAKALVLGAQDVASHTTVASTGEVSAGMVKGIGATHTIIGHSEARQRGDTNEVVKEKLSRAFEAKLSPILCIGEKERDDHGWYLSTIKDQIESACLGLQKPQLKRMLIAYEPVWAIGAQAVREATPVECREMVLFIRKILTDLYDEKTARSIPILYGGSVSEENAHAFMSDGEVTGLLVGRVSLDAKRFAKIVKASTM